MALDPIWVGALCALAKSGVIHGLGLCVLKPVAHGHIPEDQKHRRVRRGNGSDCDVRESCIRKSPWHRSTADSSPGSGITFVDGTCGTLRLWFASG